MSRRFAALAACLLAIAGCGETEPAETLVAELYERHAAGDTPFFQTTSRPKVDAYFERTLADLIWKDAVDSKGEVGALDFDPLYNAQDFDIEKLVVHPGAVAGNAARVVVSFENFGKPERLTYTLVPIGNGWRISDIEYGGGTSLRRILRRST